MSIDLEASVAPRSRRALLLGALGGLAAAAVSSVRAPAALAIDPGHVVLDGTNVGLATTEIDAQGSDPAFRVLGGAVGIRAVGTIGLDATGGPAVLATSAATTSAALLATNTAGHAARGRGQMDGTIGESTGGRSGVVGYSGSGAAAPAGPAKTGVYGEATQDAASRGVSGFSLAGQGVRGEATTGQGVAGLATTGQGVRGEATTGNGVLGVATTGQGVRGEASTGYAVRGDAGTGIGVFGQSYGSAGARGVMGKTDTGQAVRAEAATGIGVQAVATTGIALAVSGRATFSRSGRVNVPANRAYVDVTVPGGLSSAANVLATLQLIRTGVWVSAARPNYPSAGVVRIYLNKVAHATATTPLAWFVLG